MKKQNKPITQFKFLRTVNKSINENIVWKLNRWVKVDGELKMNKNGLHSCEDPYDSFAHDHGEILAIVECRGDHIKEGNEYCWREQRVVKTYELTKKDFLGLAIFSAGLCLKNFEKKLPDDKRPREAIEAAKMVLLKDTKKNRIAAESAADFAWYAISAASFFTGSFYSSASFAASSAWFAALSAYRDVEYASWCASLAVSFALSSAQFARSQGVTVKKIKNYFRQIVREKEKQKD